MIKIKNLHFKYRPTASLFNGLDLSLKSGNIYGLLGGNGSGKSTLLKIIGGLISPHTGEVKVNNHTPFERVPSFLEDIYFIPEEMELPEIKLLQFVNCYKRFYPKFDMNQFQSNIEAFGLTQELNKGINQFSFGQKKKLIISFALATNCSLMIMDEPTNGLDIPSKRIFRQLIASSVDDNKLFIISSHQVRDLFNLMDPIIILQEGELQCNISVHELESKFNFHTYKSLDMVPKDVLFYQESLGGVQCIERFQEEKISDPIDFEFFFTAMVSEKKELLTNELN
ncbi:MAG: ABC transporter ATP-binding protein [Prolixibacteraceae bacterium]|jgi:ABC-2 type transport system ATP-binding protein|nr:ABC transporter ATP-binding protein [Prolixibacteraceae bacterium]